jgi:hypothetical protein
VGPNRLPRPPVLESDAGPIAQSEEGDAGCTFGVSRHRQILLLAHGYVPNNYQGACNIPIPIQVIEMIGEKLVGKARWSKERRDAQTQTAKRKHDMWQAKANVHWKENKELTRSAVLS